MVADNSTKKPWKGIWIAGVALLHCVFAAVKFSEQFKTIIGDGVVGVANSADVNWAIWFLLFGPACLVVGLLIAVLEKQGSAIPVSVIVLLLLVVVIALLLLPVSGFWLLLPPVIAMAIDALSK